MLTRALAVALAPAGSLECGARRIAGKPLATFVAPVLDRDAIDVLAERGLDLLERLAPWGVEQVTVRTSRIAGVLTPLASGGAVVVAVRRGGPIALLEILAGRARGGAARGARGVAPAAVRVTPVADANARVGQAVRALAVLGAVLPTEAAPESVSSASPLPEFRAATPLGEGSSLSFTS